MASETNSRKRTSEYATRAVQAQTACETLGTLSWKQVKALGQELNLPQTDFSSKPKLCLAIAEALSVPEFKTIVDELPNKYEDPIWRTPLINPYIANDGETYNLTTLQGIFAGSAAPPSPLFLDTILTRNFYPNLRKRSETREWLTNHGADFSEQDAVEKAATLQEQIQRSAETPANEISTLEARLSALRRVESQRQQRQREKAARRARELEQTNAAVAAPVESKQFSESANAALAEAFQSEQFAPGTVASLFYPSYEPALPRAYERALPAALAASRSSFSPAGAAHVQNELSQFYANPMPRSSYVPRTATGRAYGGSISQAAVQRPRVARINRDMSTAYAPYPYLEDYSSPAYGLIPYSQHPGSHFPY